MINSVLKLLNEPLDRVPVLLEECVGNEVEDASALEHVLLHGRDQLPAQIHKDHQLETQKREEGSLDRSGVLGNVKFESQISYSIVLIKNIVKI